jgi:PhnB protein
MKLNTYLNFGGNCEQAFRFYEKHLGGKITMMSTFADMPPQPNAPKMSPTAILHAQIMLGDTLLMASDAPPDRFQPMRSAYLSLAVDSSDEAERIYKLLTDGGEVFMPIQETFFAFRFAMLRDKFGVLWMLIHDRPTPQNS